MKLLKASMGAAAGPGPGEPVSDLVLHVCERGSLGGSSYLLLHLCCQLGLLVLSTSSVAHLFFSVAFIVLSLLLSSGPVPSYLLHLLSCFSFIFPLLSSPFLLFFSAFLRFPKVCLHVFLLLFRQRPPPSLVPSKLHSPDSYSQKLPESLLSGFR